MSSAPQEEASTWQPRHAASLVGHAEAEQALLGAYQSGRLPHAWLIGGQKGIGKATLAFRFARFLLRGEHGADMFGTPPRDLFVDPAEPVFSRIASSGHSDLLTVERSWNDKTNKWRGEIGVDDVRRLGPFFSQTAAEGGWRVAIVDAADEMNRNAQNALLKILEEPPSRGLLLLVCHAPGRLLPTIRSRCRALALRPLDDSAMEKVLGDILPTVQAKERQHLIRLSAGSPGRAMALHAAGGIELDGALNGLLASLGTGELTGWHALADKVSRAKNTDSFEVVAELLDTWIMRQARGAALAGQPQRAQAWLEARARSTHLFERGDAVNLERKQVLLGVQGALAAAARH